MCQIFVVVNAWEAEIKRVKEKETLKDTLESPVKGRNEKRGSLNLDFLVLRRSVFLKLKRKMCFN